MSIGTKSLLVGVHHILWHPLTVFLAWKRLYGWPTWKEALCILIHDWGYFGATDIDGPSGKKHPEWAATLAETYLGKEYGLLCRGHSRSYAKRCHITPSKLCWADKLSVAYEPVWFYLWRARLSGELVEYKRNAVTHHEVSAQATDEEWFLSLKNHFMRTVTRRCKDRISHVT